MLPKGRETRYNASVWGLPPRRTKLRSCFKIPCLGTMGRGGAGEVPSSSKAIRWPARSQFLNLNYTSTSCKRRGDDLVLVPRFPPSGNVGYMYNLQFPFGWCTRYSTLVWDAAPAARLKGSVFGTAHSVMSVASPPKSIDWETSHKASSRLQNLMNVGRPSMLWDKYPQVGTCKVPCQVILCKLYVQWRDRKYVCSPYQPDTWQHSIPIPVHSNGSNGTSQRTSNTSVMSHTGTMGLRTGRFCRTSVIKHITRRCQGFTLKSHIKGRNSRQVSVYH